MAFITFCTGLILLVSDIVWRLTVSEKRLLKKLENAKKHGLAKQKIKWLPLRIITLVMFWQAYKMANLKYLWLALFVLTLCTCLYWIIMALSKKDEAMADVVDKEIDIQHIAKSSTKNTMILNGILTLIWGYAWHGIAFRLF